MIRAVLLSLLLPLSAAAQSLPADLVHAQIRPGWAGDGGTRMAAVQLSLAQGWKTYWRSPGDAGIPPQFDWSGSDNVAAVRFHWPVPQVFQTAGMDTIGYHGTLVLPMEVTPADPARPMHLRGKVDMGVCRDVCVPVSVSLAADLSGKGGNDPAIREALAHQPARGAGKASCRIDPIADGLRVTVTMTAPPQGGRETLVLEPSDPEVWTAPAPVTRNGNALTAVTELVGPSNAPFALDRSGITLTLLGNGRALELSGCPAP